MPRDRRSSHNRRAVEPNVRGRVKQGECQDEASAVVCELVYEHVHPTKQLSENSCSINCSARSQVKRARQQSASEESPRELVDSAEVIQVANDKASSTPRGDDPASHAAQQ